MKVQNSLVLAGLMASVVWAANARNNVILFIGDGMGLEHVKAGRAYVNGSTALPLSFENLGFQAQVIAAKPDGSATDSATAGTALATGYQHPVDGIISMGYNNEIKTTLVEWATAKGMRAGIVTTDEIGGATPGAFGAHEPSRTPTAAIRSDYLRRDTIYNHDPSLPHVLLGGGFNDPVQLSGSSLTYVGLAQSLGYDFVSTDSQLEANTSIQPLLGLFGGSWAPMTTMLSRTDASQPTLSQMVAKALFKLESAYGFFLVVESANIDKLSHVNDADFVAEVAELDAAVKVAVAWANDHRLIDNVVILVTADHETGGLSVPEQTIPIGTLPRMTWSSTGHTCANVPLYTSPVYDIPGQILDNTEVFYLTQDGLMYRQGGVPPVIAGLTVSGITQNSATVQWTTAEPSSSAVELKVAGTTVGQYSTPGRVTAHSVVCTELNPGMSYSVVASSTDLSRAAGTGSAAFVTPGGDPNAYVLSEPLVGPGALSGTYQGVRSAGDGQKQTVTETTDGSGLGLAVQYTLHTPVPRSEIDALTLYANTVWSAADGSADGLIAAVRVLAPQGQYYWEQIPAFPFLAEPAASYVDESGNILVRFEDGASIRRERKDTLTLDSLFGVVVKNTANATLPTVPNGTAALAVKSPSLAVNLSWPECSYETGYQIWRATGSTGWTLLAECPAGSTAYADATVVSSVSYSYVVRAFNADGYSDGNLVSVTTPVVLAAPGSLKAAQGKTGINVTWTDTNSSEGGYQLLRGPAPDSWTQTVQLPANSKSYTDKNFVKGTKYYYQVQATKDGELGPLSNLATVTTR